MEILSRESSLKACCAQRGQRHLTILRRPQLYSLPSNLQKALVEGGQKI